MIGLLLVSAGPPTSAAAPSDCSAGMPACENGPELLDEAVDRRRLLAEVGQHRRHLVGQPAEALHRRRAARAGRPAAWRCSARGRRARSAVAWLATLACVTKSATFGAVAGQRREDRVAVAARLASTRFWRARIVEDLVGLLERRVGVADGLAQVAAAPGQAGAQLVEDDRQALAVGQAQDVVDQVEVDRLGGVRDRQQVLALARPVLDLAQLRRAAGRPAGRGWVGVHSTNFSPISDCGRIVHSASRAEVVEAGRGRCAARPRPCGRA